MPLFRKRKTIWEVQKLEGYLNKVLESHIPPNYDVKSTNEIHQALDEIIRSNWEYIHPICQDFIYSWFIEFQTTWSRNKELALKTDGIVNEINATKQRVKKRLEELNRDYVDLNAQFRNLENAVEQKSTLLEELSKAFKSKSMGEEELKTRMGQRIRNMQERMIKQQELFEAGQVKVGNQFKMKVMELDEEKLNLTEQFEKNKNEILSLEKLNEELKSRNNMLRNFQSRLGAIATIIRSIPSNSLQEEI